MLPKPGRKTREEMEATSGVVEVVQRPDPPLDLTEREVEVWHQVVESLPADWFRPETIPLLAQYCRHTVEAQFVAALLDEAKARDEIIIEEVDKLQKMLTRQSQTMASLATKMRITQQSRYGARGADGAIGRSRVPGIRKPWES